MTTPKTKTPRERKLTPKQIEKLLREFDLATRVRAILESHAPYVQSAPFDPSNPERWVVLTNCGTLHVHIGHVTHSTHKAPLVFHDLGADTIFCRFSAPNRARIHTSCNPHSGKWNFHAFAGPCHGNTSTERLQRTLSEMVSHFERSLRRVMAEEERSS